MPSSIRGPRRAARAAAAVAVASALAFTAACGSDSDSNGGNGSGGGDNGGDHAPSIELPDLAGQSLEVAAVWTGAERDNFVAVLKEFEDRTGAKVSFVPSSDNVSNFVGTKIEGGAPPDIVMVPQVGVLHEFAEKGWLAPVGPSVQEQLDANFGQGWQDLGAYDGEQYGVYVKVANKSLVWYNANSFAAAGATEPTSWQEFIDTAWLLSDSGTTPVSVAGADGWTLTDWFENIYLSQAGPEAYDQLAAHEIPWTDETVTNALTTLGELFGEDTLLAGGGSGALQTDFPASVTNTFSDLEAPTSGMVYEGDFVAAFIAGNTDAVVGEDALVFPFPAVDGDAPVVTAGDAAVALTTDGTATEAQEALLAFLASTDAARIWAQPGGYLSPNHSLELEAYPDQVTQDIAAALLAAGDDFRFDMSDQAPAAFGGTTGQGMWQGLQNFLRNPADIEGAQEYLEAQAVRAYGH
ncbi:ABC transporter substrate-binding protein [Streptomyces carpaticus]|uniref:Alpha-glucoside transport system substrate-binding protein n=1 Tax=Streptomyces harbinensis TaxID=1176198 RepID=A0A1I6UW26_9ACTN|nr:MULTISPECIES: ABC transporter substrate-binding protein [Streptomyces]UWM49309.1 ABC transporter substrate-binding protein [Streptomyces carpaticus]SFT05620.1 alpha-glucoside transport system substrate-binding protein [Streptomyces harbinensis]